MTRTEEITEKQKTFSDMLNKLNEHGLMKDQNQIANINLATIAEQLSDISMSLAMLVDNIKAKEEVEEWQ